MKQGLIDRAYSNNIVLVEEIFPLMTGNALLLAPIEFANLSHYQKSKTCNGCGFSFTKIFIRDEWFGVNFYPSCCIHDYTYQDIRFPFKLANDIFKFNLYETIKYNCEQNIKRPLIDIANTYYVFVKGSLGRLAYYRAHKYMREAKG